MRRLLAELVALFAPPGCVACGLALAGADARLCPECVRALPWLRRGCPRCALPRHRGRRCPAAHAAFPRSWAPMAYQGVARRLVAAVKFRGALVVADVMAAQIAANLPPQLRDLLEDAGVAGEGVGGEVGASGGGIAGAGGEGEGVVVALVPVPAAPARRRGRGFDPARELTVALARRLDRPLADCLVRRDRAGRQVGASRRERRAPGRLVIQVRGSPPAVAILVDDVHTTGATLDASARALTAAGTRVVAAITYARTL